MSYSHHHKAGHDATESLVSDISMDESLKLEIDRFLRSSFPRSQIWREWYVNSQEGPAAGEGFRWRGRQENHTLSSGLDDYPRNRFPSDKEMHLDLLCWIALSARVSAQLSDYLSLDSSALWAEYDKYIQALEKYHWDESAGLYSDIEEYSAEGKHRYSPHIGYVSLFPLCLGLIDPSSPKLGNYLSLLEDREALRSNFGLRSLSLKDPQFGTGEDYWKGPIWININYLVLSSLHRYYMHPGDLHAERATEVYRTLREEIVTNICSQYKKTGMLWEQYLPASGKGRGTHPFAGWTALVLNIIAEKY